MKFTLILAVALFGRNAIAADTLLRCSEGRSLTIYAGSNQPMEVVVWARDGKGISLRLYSADGSNVGNVYRNKQQVGTFTESYAPRKISLVLAELGSVVCAE